MKNIFPEKWFRKLYKPGDVSPFGKVITYLFLFLCLCLFLFPLVWMISTSLKTLGQVHTVPMTWIPWPLQWSNFIEVFEVVPFGRYLWNTSWYTVVTVTATVFTSTLVAFAFARLRARGRNIWFAIVLATMMIPPQVTMIPQYLIFNEFGWLNTYLPLVIPSFGASAFLVFLLRQFYLGLPRELDDALKVDGGGTFTLYFRIILPLSIPAMTTAAILEFMYRWNDLIGPLIYLSSTDKYPLSLGLANFTSMYTATPWNLLMAASLIAILPPLILFFIFQKHVIKGIVISGAKG
ncbi:carbohydrate ABC transporter permease [Bacillus sp. SD088]|uniref:carbohydrate ABC transporter permease n=1 Tax=Bacillus sp. SD088 TaxID=2782012 RepID=UPI001F60A0C0|nr:carbohydrate ABC transporter permease [Bacillus sp. SD088]